MIFRIIQFLLVVQIIILKAWCALEDGQPLVTIQQGTLQGSTGQTFGKNRTYYAFRGIPYGKPPVEDLRFRAPQKASAWNGTLDATKDRSQCVQMNILDVSGSEDCLYINVYTPEIHANLPVMVWIYGGGFSGGNSSYDLYNPENFLDEDVVFVSFNYRLGVFGFLSTGTLDSPGNWGLKDQVLALEWVKENVKEFGGNPNNVTIFGQSAGSASVSYLVQSHKAKGLFNRAIMESGTSLSLWSLSTNASSYAFQVSSKLGLNATDTESLVDQLRKVDYVKLKQAENEVSVQVLVSNILAGIPFSPVIEPAHRDAFLIAKSHENLKNGKFNRVPVIVGYNSNEAGVLELFIDFIRPFLLAYELDISKLTPYDLTNDSLYRSQVGLAIKSHYFGSDSLLFGSPQAIVDFFNEDQFNRPIRETVNQMSKYTDVYFYTFSYIGSDETALTGVPHQEELRYLFKNDQNDTEADQLTRTRLLKLWTNLAKYGNPTPNNDDQLFQNVTWLTAKQGLDRENDDVNYLDIGSDLQMYQNPNQTDWEFYRDIYENYGDQIYTTY